MLKFLQKPALQTAKQPKQETENWAWKWITVNGQRMCVPLNDRIYAVAHAEAPHPYEPWLLPHLNAHLPEGGVFLDVGANLGVHSFYGAKLVGTSGRVYAVEGSPLNAAGITHTVKNRSLENIVVLPMLASDKVAEVSFLNFAASSNQSIKGGLPAELYEAYDGKPTYTLALTQKLDDVLLPLLQRLDLVKLDVEGHEPYALQGMQALLQKFKPHILAEYHVVVETKTYPALLFAMGYKAQCIAADGTLGVETRSLAALEQHYKPVFPDATSCDLLFSPV